MEKIKGMLGIRDFRNALAPIAGSFYFQKSSKSEFNILLTGLDIAGKTTFLYGLNLGKVKTDIPFIGMNIEKLQYRNIQFCSWDVGGGCKPGTYLILRSLFRHSKGIIIVVDCNDRERIVEVREELQTRIFEEDRDARKRCPQVLEKIWEKQDAERDFLMGLPMLVLANKQDIEVSVPLRSKVVALTIFLLTVPAHVGCDVCRRDIRKVTLGRKVSRSTVQSSALFNEDE
ncbi:MAG: hypothetical protein M1820_007658 [Bogoriella megaspora]|nr:MAG: hypothetical protein M1820_007658 [Bogoriella megaspora]